RDAHAVRVAAHLFRHLADAAHERFKPAERRWAVRGGACIRRHSITLDLAVPAVAEARRAPKRRVTVTANPDLRTRFLERFRVSRDIAEPDILSLKAWPVLNPCGDHGL